MKFTLNRDLVVDSTSGHVIEFLKDVPTHVPPEMYARVKTFGAIPESDVEEVVVPGARLAPEDPAERKEQILMAIQIVAERNKTDEFTANGSPSTKALAIELGWSVAADERDLLWAEFQSGT